MAYHALKSCPVCAWRANCVKRSTGGGDGILNCPEFTEDLLLRKEREEQVGKQEQDKEDEV